MCIAIVTKPGQTVTDTHLYNSFKNNPDGCGFAYISTDYTGHSKLKIVKTMDYKIFLRKYKRAVLNHPESPFLIHFRVATHGTVDRFNCHPFKIKDDMVFIHNGVIQGVGVEQLRSDTQLFNDNILKKLPKGWETNEGVQILLEKFILSSKLCLLKLDGSVIIFNESLGHWKDDIWYSNYTYSYESYKTSSYKTSSTIFGFGKQKSSVQERTMFLCEGCNIMNEEHSCHFFLKGRNAICYCSDCVDVAYSTEAVSFKDKVSKFKYIREERYGGYGANWDDSQLYPM